MGWCCQREPDLYPLQFEDGGEVRFRAAIPEGGVDTSIYFTFEANPYPNNSPSFNTEAVIISGGLADYSVQIPPQDPNQEFNSFLMYIVERDQSVMVKDIEVFFVSDGPSESMDTDMDGVPDDEDAFPTEPAASVDADMDGMPDAWNDGATQEQIDASGLMLDDDPTTPGGGPGGPMEPPVADFTEAFGGAISYGLGDFNVPTTAESWAGFANINTALYPLSFPEGGRISFMGSVADGGTADVRFRLERLPYDENDAGATEPSIDTGVVTVSGADPMLYEIMIEPQGENTYSSFIMYIDTRDVTVNITNVVVDSGIPPVFAVMTGVFDGFVADGDTFTFPTGAAEWAGVANENPDLYPLHFGEGGEVRFRAAIPEGGADTNIRFLFEANPYPNNNPSVGTENVLISGGLMDYSVQIPPQDPNQDFNSFLMYIVERDQSVMVKDIEVVMYGDGPTEPMDTDMDGVPDDEDAFPTEPAASVDADMDGMPDAWNDGATQEQIDASGLMLDDDPTTPGGGPGGPMEPPVADFSGVFGGAQAGADNTFTVPTGSESWAGFANVNAELYPITLEEGGRISFLGSVADGGSADVRFRFEYKPSPDTEPSYNTTSVTVSGADPVLYEIMLEPQGTNTYESLIMYIDTRDVTVTITDVVVDFGTPPVFAVMTGVFDGFLADGDTYEFPTGAAEWAGVANTNVDLYPLHFGEGGEVRFRAAIPEGGADTNIRFLFEANPYPNNNPSVGTENVLISGGLADYSVQIPPQDPNQDFNSFLMYIVERDQSVMVKDIEVVMYGDGPTEPMDTDMDGVPDDEDAFPTEPAASVDADMDGMPDAWNDGATQEQIDASGLMLDDDPTTPGGGPGGPMEPIR